MVLLEYNSHVIRFYTSIGSHLLGECSGWFFKRHFCAESILIDNGVYHLLRHNKQMHYKLVVKYGVQNIRKVLNLVRRKDIEIYIVIPDYPFDRKLNHECYKLFKTYYKDLFKNYKTIYVLHGYWNAILNDVDVDLVAIPFNTLSDIPIKDLRGRKTYRIDSNVGKYVIVKTIEYVKKFGYDKVHILGPTKLTLKRIFKQTCQKLLFDDVKLDMSFVRHIYSFDTVSHHFASSSDIRLVDYGKGKYMIPNRNDEIELKWLMKWLEGLPFNVIKI